MHWHSHESISMPLPQTSFQSSFRCCPVRNKEESNKDGSRLLQRIVGVTGSGDSHLPSVRIRESASRCRHHWHYLSDYISSGLRSRQSGCLLPSTPQRKRPVPRVSPVRIFRQKSPFLLIILPLGCKGNSFL